MIRRTTVLLSAALALASCGSDDSSDAETTIVVTTSVLADVVSEVVGDQADVVTIMPVGVDPHDYQPSARDVDRIGRADVLIVNGGGFEEGLLDVVESAEQDGVPTFVAVDAASTDDDDPHFFTDPGRMSDVVQEVSGFLAAEVDGLDADELAASTEDYLEELSALDDEVAGLVATVEPDDRLLVTNHDVFGYFADRYGFEIVGVVVPGGSTSGGASAGQLAELVAVIESAGVTAIFVDASSPTELAETLADEVGPVVIIELYTESLGPPDSDGATYVEMVRTNAERIVSALTNE